MPKLFAILAVLILFPLAGLAVVWGSASQLMSSRATQQWPEVQGQILSSELVMEQVYGRSGPANSRRTPSDIYSAQVEYEYTVDGEAYKSTRIALVDQASTDRRQAELTVERFPPGSVTVYYNPANPEEAVLSPGEFGAILPGLVIGALIAIFPPVFVVIGLREEYIEPPELPLLVRMWWLKYLGPKRVRVPEREPAGAAPKDQKEASLDVHATAPPAENFRESIRDWRPGARVELAFQPPSVWLYLGIAIVAGGIAAWALMIPVNKLVYGREAIHLPELRTVAAGLFLCTTTLAFVVLRIIDRGSSTVVDWQQGTVRFKRDFARPVYQGMNDVTKVVIRCKPVKGRSTKYRAAVELDVFDRKLQIAHTCEQRRKPESAQEKAASLAEPLAKELGKPLDYQGWP